MFSVIAAMAFSVMRQAPLTLPLNAKLSATWNQSPGNGGVGSVKVGFYDNLAVFDSPPRDAEPSYTWRVPGRSDYFMLCNQPYGPQLLLNTPGGVINSFTLTSSAVSPFELVFISPKAANWGDGLTITITEN